MEEPRNLKRKIRIISILAGILLIIIIGFIIGYRNINYLLTNALEDNWQSGFLSEVYDLKFENLQVDPLKGNIQVNNVTLTAKKNLPEKYNYINSSVNLNTDKLLLKNVEIFKLLRTKVLVLETIEIRRPTIEMHLAGENYVFFPIPDAPSVKPKKEKGDKISLHSFSLKQFLLVDANLHSVNAKMHREFSVENLNLDIHELFYDWEAGKNILQNKYLGLSIEGINGKIGQGRISTFSIADFAIGVDSFVMRTSIDTTLFQYYDFNTEFHTLDVQTKDSIAHFILDSAGMHYRSKSMGLRNIYYKPNVSDAELQKDVTFQKAQFSGTIGALNIWGIEFDSLIFRNKVIVDSITVENIDASIYKDKTKALNTTKLPEYLAQQLQGVTVPLQIQQVLVRNANIASKEKLPSGKIAVVNVQNLEGKLTNITNQSSETDLILSGSGYIEGKVYFSANLAFNYNLPQFTFTSSFRPFALTDLNHMIQQFAPVAILSGTADKILLNGIAYKTYATGTMQFLYHDFKIDIDLKDKAKWLNAVISVAANTYLKENNPEKPGLPPHIGNFRIDRNMNKEFINVVLLSAFSGMKETIVLSKEAKKDYKKAKSDSKERK